ncbi:phosphoadenosine phosphosulfate reductase [Phaeovulum sp. W22_SRMD_FR3]|uniref:phosphoadenosine phosphosulfate reductase n=1 Tax=Phaeovulum sp. W22_SRMD_FR3 TaxID=3240274 RepID=UPI003F949F57
MTQTLPETDLTQLSAADWLARLEDIGEEAGYFEPLGARHSAFFADEGPVLLVTFETMNSIRDSQDDQLPMGYAITRKHGWSHLSIIAHEDSWYRDPRVFAYFDRLVDDAFFEDFDQVVFYGAGMAAYAAAAFSVTAPGATVLLVQPQATLDPRVSGWDNRHTDMRRTSFTDRYGYAPDMIEGAGEVFVVFDPDQPLDAMHAALFTKPFVTKLPCPYAGSEVADLLSSFKILQPLLEAACEGKFTASTFWKLYRARRNSPRFLRQISGRLLEEGRPFLNALLCRNAATRLNGPRFRARQGQLEAELKAQGRCLPPVRRPELAD